MAATKRLADFAERNPEQQARWANSLSVRLSAVGDWEGTLGAAREAVGLYRALAEAAPAAYRPDLAMSLNNLANILSAVGDWEGALGAAREAVGLYRALVVKYPASHTSDLAASLHILAASLSEAGQREEALAVFIADFDHFSPATRAYLLLARASWRDDDEEDDLTAAAREADAADASAFLGPVRRMIAHAIADSGLELEGLPPVGYCDNRFNNARETQRMAGLQRPIRAGGPCGDDVLVSVGLRARGTISSRGVVRGRSAPP